MRETTLDDVCELLETLIDATNQSKREVCSTLDQVLAAVWDTAPS